MSASKIALVAGVIMLAAAEGRAQIPLGPPPVPPGAPPPPALPAVSTGSPAASTPPGPSYDGLSVAPQASYGQGSGALATMPGGVDDLTLLSGLILQVQNLQDEAESALSTATGGASANRDAAFRDLVRLTGTVDGILAGAAWQNAVARARAGDDPRTSTSSRYLAVFGSGGAMDRIAREQARLHLFTQPSPAPSPGPAPGAPPSPEKGKTAFLPPSPEKGLPLPPVPVKGLPPVPTSTPAPLPSPAPAPGGEDLAAIQKKIDDIGLALANPALTKQQKNDLEIERNAYVQRLAELARKAPGADTSAPPPPVDGHQPAPAASTQAAQAAPAPAPSAASPATGSTSVFLQKSGSTETRGGSPQAPAAASPLAGIDPAALARVPLVPNSYGIAPPVVTDAEIHAIMDPLIEAQLPVENAKLAGQGLSMNKYRQVVGSTSSSTIKSNGRPDYDHYRQWLKDSPAMIQLVEAKVNEIYAAKARAIAPTLPAPAPAAPPAVSGNPSARTPGAAAPGKSRPPGGAIDSGLPPGSTLPNGKLDLPSSSAGQ